MPPEQPTGPMKVQLHCKELKRYRLRFYFYDSQGIAVGKTYQLDGIGENAGTHEWEIIRMFDRA